MKQDSINKPPIGTANTGHQYAVENKPPFGETLIAELKRIMGISRERKKSNDDSGQDLNSPVNTIHR